MSKLGTRILTSNLPRDGAVRTIALHLKGIDAPSQGAQTIHPTRQATALKNADLDFGHIQPTAVFGRVVKLDAPENTTRFLRWEGFIDSRWGMGIQIVLHNAHIFRVRIHLINQPADLLSIVEFGAVMATWHIRSQNDHLRLPDQSFPLVRNSIQGRGVRVPLAPSERKFQSCKINWRFLAECTYDIHADPA